ncbi:MAG: MFS transporter [Spirochaetales bacterium]|nr:MFS transporter [Spirochaetales bacterium]MBP7263078.1 MFS transporter [Spirochaetia bacterium]
MSTSHSPAQTRWAPRFFLIWTGQALSLFGSSVVQFALVWWMTRTTGSATALAAATIVAILPQIVLGPFIGPLVDRLDRKRIMIVADSGIALATAGLMLLFWFDAVQLWHVYALIGLRSLGGAFHHPAMASSTSLLVPEEHLTRVGGLNQTLQGVMAIVAPPLGALLVMVVPTQGILAIDVVTAALAVLPLFFVHIPMPARSGTEARDGKAGSSYVQDLKHGLQYIVRWPGLFGLIAVAMLVNFLLVPSSSLMPLLVTKSFGRSALELAWTETAMGVGIIAGGLALSAWGGFKRRIVTSIMGIAGLGLGVFLIGAAPMDGFWVVLAGCFVVGAMQSAANGPIHAILQSAVRQDMQGRVFSLVNAAATAMMPLSLVLAGPLSDSFGVRTWYLAGGAVCVVVALLTLGIPAIMNIEETRTDRAGEVPAQPGLLETMEPAVQGTAQTAPAD